MTIGPPRLSSLCVMSLLDDGAQPCEEGLDGLGLAVGCEVEDLHGHSRECGYEQVQGVEVTEDPLGMQQRGDGLLVAPPGVLEVCHGCG